VSKDQRREKYEREPSLGAIAAAQPLTGRGFAASKGIRIPYAKRVGQSSRQKLHPSLNPDHLCMAETFCDEPRREGFFWCERHASRAEQLGVAVPALSD